MCFLLKLCEETRRRAGNCPRGGAKKFFSGKPLQIMPICAILLLSRKLNLGIRHEFLLFCTKQEVRSLVFRILFILVFCAKYHRYREFA